LQSKIGQTFLSLLATMFCIGFPAVWTIFAPLSYVSLRYDDEVVSASVTHFVYLVVPYRTEQLAQVSTINTTYQEGYTDHGRPGGSRRNVQVQAKSSLVFSGPEGNIAVMVSPMNIDGVKERVQAFMAHPRAAGMNFVAVANWKFSVIFGALVSFIPWLLAFSFVYEIGLRLRRGACWLAQRIRLS
jgi:hypothetical protein